MKSIRVVKRFASLPLPDGTVVKAGQIVQVEDDVLAVALKSGFVECEPAKVEKLSRSEALKSALASKNQKVEKPAGKGGKGGKKAAPVTEKPVEVPPATGGAVETKPTEAPVVPTEGTK